MTCYDYPTGNRPATEKKKTKFINLFVMIYYERSSKKGQSVDFQ